MTHTKFLPQSSYHRKVRREHATSVVSTTRKVNVLRIFLKSALSHDPWLFKKRGILNSHELWLENSAQKKFCKSKLTSWYSRGKNFRLKKFFLKNDLELRPMTIQKRGILNSHELWPIQNFYRKVGICNFSRIDSAVGQRIDSVGGQWDSESRPMTIQKRGILNSHELRLIQNFYRKVSAISCCANSGSPVS